MELKKQKKESFRIVDVESFMSFGTYNKFSYVCSGHYLGKVMIYDYESEGYMEFHVVKKFKDGEVLAFHPVWNKIKFRKDRKKKS